MLNKRLATFLISITSLCSPSLAASSLPGDATSLNEQHGNWWVRCGLQGKADATTVACTVVQQQLQKSTNQRILTVAVSVTPDGGAKGTVVMPFGLAIQKGIQLQLDEGAQTQPILFHTCLPSGCLVSVDWQSSTLDAMRNAKVLHVAAVSDDGQPAKFDVPLEGFGSAVDRAQQLTAP